MKYTDPDGRKVIVGISTSDSFFGKIFGDHAFIMCINEINPKKSLMLDASGSFGAGRSADILDGNQETITIENYLKYWDSDETLITFELNLTSQQESKIKDAIGNIEGRSWLTCAIKASNVLNKNLSKKIEECNTPKQLLQEMRKYSKDNLDTVKMRVYDMKTNQEITDEK